MSSVLYKLFNICAINMAGNQKELGLYSEGDSSHIKNTSLFLMHFQCKATCLRGSWRTVHTDTQPVTASAPAENWDSPFAEWELKHIRTLRSSQHAVRARFSGELNTEQQNGSCLLKIVLKPGPEGLPHTACRALGMRSNRTYRKLNMEKISKLRIAQKTPHFHQQDHLLALGGFVWPAQLRPTSSTARK